MAFSGNNPRVVLAATLSDLLATYSQQHRPFTAWESHCLGTAIALLRHGFYDRALEHLNRIPNPPAGSPMFPLPRSLTLNDLQQAIVLVANS